MQRKIIKESDALPARLMAQADRSEPAPVNEAFRKFSHKVSCIVGSPMAFGISVITILVWAVMGPFFHYSDTWQLVINTATTIVTFLMVFLIQNTQNRDARAIHLKLDELIRGVEGARNTLVNLESMSDAELDRLESEFHDLKELAGSERQRRKNKKHP